MKRGSVFPPPRALPGGSAPGRGTAGPRPAGAGAGAGGSPPSGKGKPRPGAAATGCPRQDSSAAGTSRPGAGERGGKKKKNCVTLCNTGRGIFLPSGTYREAGQGGGTSPAQPELAEHGLRDRSPSLSRVGAKSEVWVVVWSWVLVLFCFPSLKQ